MAKIPNTTAVAAPVAVADSRDTHPSVLQLYTEGGLKSVQNLIQLNEIPLERRVPGMLVWVEALQAFYQAGPRPAMAFGAAPFVPGPSSDNVFANTDDGLLATDPGKFFYVGDAIAEELILYRNASGVAARVGEFPSMSVLAAQVSASEQNKDLARKWAVNPTDVPVTPDQFSARHYAVKASISEASASNSALEATESEQAASVNAQQAKDSKEASQGYADGSRRYRDQARAAADAVGPGYFFDTYAAAMAALETIKDAAVVEVWQDETRSGRRAAYVKEPGSLIFKIDFPGDTIVSDLASASPGLGADIVPSAVRRYSSIAGLKQADLSETTDRSFAVAAFWPNGTGGGDFYFDASRPKAQHNGGTVLAPERLAAWNGTKADLHTLFSAAGLSGFGCFVRVIPTHEEINVDWFGTSKDGTDDSIAINQALSLGKRTVGNGKYSVAQPIRVRHNGQSFEGSGTYVSELEWIGGRTDANPPTSENTLNMFELCSGRRDTGNQNAAVTQSWLRNWKLSTRTGSYIKNLVWVEAGNFHGGLEKLRVFDVRGWAPTEALIKLDTNGGQSYSVGMIYRDIVATGGANDSTTPVPVGIWAEGFIEALFDSVKVYNVQVGWRFGTPVSENVRNVVDGTFLHCQSEIGDRGYADGNGVAMQFYQGRHLTFFGCKLIAGADFTVPTTQVPLQFTGLSTFQNKSITFEGSTIWGVGACENAAIFDGAANYQGIRFRATEFYQFTGDLIAVSGGDVPTIFFDPDNTYVQCTGKSVSMDVESTSRATFTIANAAGMTLNQQTGNATTQHNTGDPIIVGHSTDTQGLIISAYKSAQAISTVRAYNRTGGAITVASGHFYTRTFRQHALKAQAKLPYDPASIPSQGALSVQVPVPGAVLGDFAIVGFSAPMQAVNLFAYVSAADVVTVIFVNRTGGTVDLAAGVICVQLVRPIFDYAASVSYDAPSLAAGAGVTHTLSIPGCALGDIAICSLGVDALGIVGFAWVSSAGTVSVRFQNESGATVDLPSTTLRVGVIKTARSI